MAGLIAEKTPESEYPVHPERVEEVVADKGHHSNDVALGLAELEVRTYIAEPDHGQCNWDGKVAEKAAVYGNRRRIEGDRGKRLQRQRGERIERNFAHQFETGGLDRLYVRGFRPVLRISQAAKRIVAGERQRTAKLARVPGERAQEISDPSCRMQSRSVNAIKVWLGQAQSCS